MFGILDMITAPRVLMISVVLLKSGEFVTPWVHIVHPEPYLHP